MKNYLKPLATKIEKLLPKNTYFSLDDSEQSYNMYPTNYVNLVDDFVSIQVAKVIYNNITEYKTILDNISELYQQAIEYSSDNGVIVSITYIESDQAFRLISEFYDGDIETEKDFATVEELINYLKIYK